MKKIVYLIFAVFLLNLSIGVSETSAMEVGSTFKEVITGESTTCGLTHTDEIYCSGPGFTDDSNGEVVGGIPASETTKQLIVDTTSNDEIYVLSESGKLYKVGTIGGNRIFILVDYGDILIEKIFISPVYTTDSGSEQYAYILTNKGDLYLAEGEGASKGIDLGGNFQDIFELVSFGGDVVTVFASDGSIYYAATNKDLYVWGYLSDGKFAKTGQFHEIPVRIHFQYDIGTEEERSFSISDLYRSIEDIYIKDISPTNTKRQTFLKTAVADIYWFDVRYTIGSPDADTFIYDPQTIPDDVKNYFYPPKPEKTKRKSIKSCGEEGLVCSKNIFGYYTWRLNGGKFCSGDRVEFLGKSCIPGEKLLDVTKKPIDSAVVNEIVTTKNIFGSSPNGIDGSEKKNYVFTKKQGETGVVFGDGYVQALQRLPFVPVELQEVNFRPVVGTVKSTRLEARSSLLKSIQTSLKKKKNTRYLKNRSTRDLKPIELQDIGIKSILRGFIPDKNNLMSFVSIEKAGAVENIDLHNEVKKVVRAYENKKRKYIAIGDLSVESEKVLADINFFDIPAEKQLSIKDKVKEVEKFQTKKDKLDYLYVEFENLLVNDFETKEEKRLNEYHKLEIAMKIVNM